MTSSARLPDEQLARQLVLRDLGLEAALVRRFTTGSMHYVYEATFDNHASVVVRIAAAYGHEAMRGAARLSKLLRPRGAPLPAILAEDLNPPFPHLILERLAGSDLGEVVGTLPHTSLDAIAAAVVDAQRATAQSQGCARKYGYAVAPEEAPYSSWPEVLAAHLQRSQKRMAASGIFAVSDIEPLSGVLRTMDRELAAIPATAFLHDATTKNVIVSPQGRLSGIVDVDDLCFGDPRYAVALTWASLLTSGDALYYADSWTRIAGFSKDRLFQLYVALFLADFMAERGQEFNGNRNAANPESDKRLRRLYIEALAQLGS